MRPCYLFELPLNRHSTFGCKNVVLTQKDERTRFANPDFPKSFKTKKKGLLKPSMRRRIDRLRDEQLRKRTAAKTCRLFT
jgi:hypothetical protein